MAGLRSASFRGVPFFIENDSIEYGRRILVHEFYGRDAATEDLGPKTIKFKATAYVVSDTASAQKDALVAACNTEGPATLQLPAETPVQVVCDGCTRQFNKDKLGYFAFELTFVKDNSVFGPLPIAALERALLSLVDNLGPSMTSNFLSSFNTLGELPWVVSNATTFVQGWALAVDSIRANVPMSAGAAATLAQSIVSLFDSASTLALDGQTPIGGVIWPAGANIASGAVSYSSATASNGAFVASVMDLMRTFGDGATDQGAFIDAAESLSQYSLTATGVPGLSVSGKANDANIAALGSTVRRAALVEMAAQAALADFTDRTAAIRARARVAQAFDRELAACVGAGDLYRQLDNIRGTAIQAISRKVADLRPTVTVTSNTVMPSIVWGYRLYGDASKASDLIARNRVPNPAYMPTTFEAAAP